MFAAQVTLTFFTAVHRGQEIPDPIKLVRRLTALELALGNLKNDCEFISTKRTEIVKSVMETQLENIFQAQEVNQHASLLIFRT